LTLYRAWPDAGPKFIARSNEKRRDAMVKAESGIVRFGAAMFVCAICLPAHADYKITPLSGGLSSIFSGPGDSFSLDLVLTSDTADTHLSSEFRVLFSEPGLKYVSYNWGDGYTTGGQDDISSPCANSQLIDAASYALTADVDLFFSNLTNDGAVFGVGTILSLLLEVPSDWFKHHPGVYQVEVSIVPELFFDGFNVIPTTAGGVFLVNIPGPAAIGLLALAGAIRPRRRRS